MDISVIGYPNQGFIPIWISPNRISQPKFHTYMDISVIGYPNQAGFIDTVYGYLRNRGRISQPRFHAYQSHGRTPMGFGDSGIDLLNGRVK